MRWARKTDTTQEAIVAAIRACGWHVWIIEEPCDLLCFKAGTFKTLECKTPRNRRGDPRMDKRQRAQAAFCALTNTPYVTTPEAALEALGESLAYFGEP
jgi:hypothetical protein